MNKTLALAALLAAVSFAAPQIIAGETTDPAKSTGAASDQKPGTETSDRTPEKTTPTPDTQVDKSMTGETSDRTPNEATGPAKKMTTESKEPAGPCAASTRSIHSRAERRSWRRSSNGWARGSPSIGSRSTSRAIAASPRPGTTGTS